MSYEIIIKETTTKEQLSKSEWTKIDTEEVKRDSSFYAGITDESKTLIKAVYGHTPRVTETVTESVEIYKQTVYELDLAKVIKAINDLE